MTVSARHFALAVPVALALACGGCAASRRTASLPAPSDGAVARPFPQHVQYTRGSIAPRHISQERLDGITADFYRQWKLRYLAQGCGPDRYYVAVDADRKFADRRPDHQTITVSEAHGYGMIILAYMAGHDPEARAYFDGMYRYFRDHPSRNDTRLMAWAQVDGCVDAPPPMRGTISATDGDLDIAYALLLADRQWSSRGEINYRAEALRTIKAILASEVAGRDSHLLLGDWVAGKPEYADGTRSSDFMPAHLKAFAAATAEPRWAALLDNGYSTLQRVQSRYSPEAGLWPDFIRKVPDGPRPAGPNYLERQTDAAYSYNACRVPLRLGLDYLLTGDPRALQQLKPVHRWIRKTARRNPRKVGDGYGLNGVLLPGSDSRSAPFLAGFAIAAMADGGDQRWLNDTWNALSRENLSHNDYYGNTLKLMAMLVMSRNWWQPADQSLTTSPVSSQ